MQIDVNDIQKAISKYTPESQVVRMSSAPLTASSSLTAALLRQPASMSSTPASSMRTSPTSTPIDNTTAPQIVNMDNVFWQRVANKGGKGKGKGK